jgi:small multidrug resistance family-3 protein
MSETVLYTLGLFFFAALLEIGGGYLVWKWLRIDKRKIFGIIGGLILFSYGIVMTFQLLILVKSMQYMVESLLYHQ